MNAPRAISGDFADLKSVKTRSVVQIVIECPIEEGESIVRMFGFPQPGKPVRVAVARLLDASVAKLDKPLSIEPSTAPHSYAQRVAILCGKVPFRKFLNEKFKGDAFPVDTAEDAAALIRTLCSVTSRREILPDNEPGRIWNDLRVEYENWERGLSDPSPVPERTVA